MSRNIVARARLDSIERTLEAVVLECFDLAAAVADEMVVMTLGPHRLVTRNTGTEIDPLHKPLRRQQIQDPVHTGDADTAPRRAQQVENLLRRKTAVLSSKKLDHGTARASLPKTLPEQSAGRRIDPITRRLGLSPGH
jgi:hypothetical protein